MANSTKYLLKLAFIFKFIGYWLWYLLALVILVLTQFPEGVSKYYTNGFFKWLGLSLRKVSGLFPNAIGEYVYLFIIIMLIINILRSLYQYKDQYKNNKNFKPILQTFFVKSLKNLTQLYVLFMLIWGLNYQQSSPAKQFGIEVKESYSDVAIERLTIELIEELNSTRAQIPDSSISQLTIKQIFTNAIQDYAQMEPSYPFLKLQQPSLKLARFPAIGDYIGFMAYYQPITGEAIIRGDVPKLTLPFTTCHEMAHQLGYASETEANFIAFVVGSESRQPIFKYSMLLQLFTYAQSAELTFIAKTGNFENWKKVVARNKSLLSPVVLADRKKIKLFFIERQDLLIPASTSMYNQFLQWNKQAKGIESYNDVLLWALAYRSNK